MANLNLSTMGFGITGAVPHEIVRDLAPAVEKAGFGTLWVNHGGDGDALASMAVAASVTRALRVASGVIPLDRVPAEQIVTRLNQSGLPPDRTIVGIGASGPPSPLTTVREGARLVRSNFRGRVMVGALGPKMRRLGVRDTDGVLLNWLTPEGAKSAMEERAEDIADLPGNRSTVSLYVRCALGSDAIGNLDQEAKRYASIPSYAANFARLGFSARDAAVGALSPDDMRGQLSRWSGIVDEVVLRAITADESLDAYLELVRAARGT